MEMLIPTFEILSRDEILAFPTGRYGDYELLSVCEYFENINDHDREIATYELILRSPEVSEMTAYEQLYFDVVNYYRQKKKYLQATQWCYALIAFTEQHNDGQDRANHRLDLAATFLEKGEINLGLALYTQILSADAENPWIYNELGLVLPKASLGGLAVQALEQGLKRVAQNDPEALQDQLEDLLHDARELADKMPSQQTEMDTAVLKSFREALHSPAKSTADASDEALPYPPRIARLAEPNAASTCAAILAAGQLFAPALIQLAYSTTDAAGSTHAITLLRTLRDKFPQEFKFLSPWLDQAAGNWRDELLSSRIGKIGGYTTRALQTFASDTRHADNICAAATEALVERGQRRPEWRDQVVAFFRELLTRPEAYNAAEENFIARVVGDCVDLDARELYPEIKQVFDEDRLEPGWLDLDYVHTQWELPEVPAPARADGLYLPLLCKKCGRTREHFAEYVLVDINSLGDDGTSSRSQTRYDAHILDHEIICPKCGAVDQYEMTSMAYLRMTTLDALASIFQNSSSKKTKPPQGNPRVLHFRSSVFGEIMHPLEGLDKYRRQIALNPQNAMLHAKMGALLRILMRYPESLQALRHAYQLDPDDPEVIIRRALTEHDLGDRDTAQMLYQKIVDQVHEKPFFQRMDDDNLAGAMEGLRNLKRNRPSPAEITLNLSDGTPVPHPSIVWRQQQIQGQSPISHPKPAKGKTKRGRRGRRKK